MQRLLGNDLCFCSSLLKNHFVAEPFKSSHETHSSDMGERKWPYFVPNRCHIPSEMAAKEMLNSFGVELIKWNVGSADVLDLIADCMQRCARS
jgi:hypothetical protein